MHPRALLRTGLLEGQTLALAAPGAGRGQWSAPVRAGLQGLDARVQGLEWDAGDGAAVEAAVSDALDARGTLDCLVNDGAGAFAAIAEREAPGHGAALEALRASVDGTFNATRAVVNGAFIPARRGGRVISIAPPADAGPHAETALAALENMSRTLSIEWARYQVRVTTIVPPTGAAAPEAVAALVAFLASPAGDYYSGCLLDLRGIRHPSSASLSAHVR